MDSAISIKSNWCYSAFSEFFCINLSSISGMHNKIFFLIVSPKHATIASIWSFYFWLGTITAAQSISEKEEVCCLSFKPSRLFCCKIEFISWSIALLNFKKLLADRLWNSEHQLINLQLGLLISSLSSKPQATWSCLQSRNIQVLD